MQTNRERVIPEAVKSMVKDLHRKQDPVHIRENYKTRLKDLVEYIEEEILKFDIDTGVIKPWDVKK